MHRQTPNFRNTGPYTCLFMNNVGGINNRATGGNYDDDDKVK